MNTEWDDLDHLKQHLERALEAVYDSYQPAFFRWLRLRQPALDEHEIADIFQDAVILVWNNVQQERLAELSSSLWTYLCGIGKNLAFAYIRKRNRTQYFNDMTAYLREIDPVGELDILAQEDLETIWKHIDRMDEPYCSILTLTFKYGMKSETIAETLGAASADVIRVQRNRGMNQLRKIFRTQKI